MALLALAGCNPVAIDVFETCEIEVAPSAVAGAPGDVVVLSGGPQTTHFDTRIEVGGIPAAVLDVVRNSDCETCEECRIEAGCVVCGTCLGTEIDDPTTRESCFGDPFDDASPGACGRCEESVSFVVPALAPGPTTVVVINAHGASAPFPFEIVGGDTGQSDTGPSDTGPSDTGPSDTGPSDTGATDTGRDETGEAGGQDTGVSDTGPNDTGPSDTGPSDTAATGDTGASDTGASDTGRSDTGRSDTGAATDTAHTGSTGGR